MMPLLRTLLLCCCLSLATTRASLPPYLMDTSNAWVDSVLQTMTLEEKIGQLFMVAAYSNKDEAHYQSIEKYIRDYKIGGLIFFQGTALKQAELTNRYQAISRLPLWIGFDGEWGLGMRLDKTISYPRQLVLGAIDQPELIYDMATEMARQMKRIGIHINFAPVIDVNNNPDNPVINDRSFGDNKFGVTRKAIAYMQGLQDHGVMACGKHFPGHGDTDVDSHKDMPVLKHTAERLEAIELYPFRQLIRYGVGSMMVAHMNVLALDNTPNLPTTLSPKVVQQKLINEMGFRGLVFTDALNMKGVAKFYPSGIAEVKAIQAGCDVLLFPEDVDAALSGIRKAVLVDSIISPDVIEAKARKILLAKYWLGLHQLKPVVLDGIDADINNEGAQFMKQQLLEHAITVVQDSLFQIPIVNLQRKIAHVSVGAVKPTVFAETLDLYAGVDHFFVSKEETPAKFQSLLGQLKDYQLIIADVQSMSRFASKNYGLNDNAVYFLRQLQQQNNVVLTLFGTPYSLKHFQEFGTILVAYNDDSIAQSLSAQILMGARGAEGTLPVTVGRFQYGKGECTGAGLRLKYGLPVEAGMQTATLQQIETIVQKAISSRVFPGCQVLVAKKGTIVYQKSFGTQTYESGSRKITNSDLYDIASLTKVTATTPLVMKMQEQGKLDINKKLGDYSSFPAGSNKAGLVIREILCHQAGLPAWIPFYKRTLDSLGGTATAWYSPVANDTFRIRILDSLYLHRAFTDSIRQIIDQCELGPKSYKYSDLGYYLLQPIIEKTYGDSLQHIARRYVYAPLGMNNTMYNPKWSDIPLIRIVPTEQEKNFRKTLLHGTVHDQGAALLGGVAGHAGLFSNANDLAKYFQLLLNNGTYGGYRYYQESTVKAFTTKQFLNNRRGIGFDKPAPAGQDGPTCDAASPESYGHTGFTGTMAWADPKEELIYIFLSNRVYPSSEVNQLAKQGIRTKIQQVIYDAIKK